MDQKILQVTQVDGAEYLHLSVNYNSYFKTNNLG